MHDDLTQYLLSDRRPAHISPEMLELMGKQAANYYLNDGISLNESIVKLASAHPDINGEQVKRVVEFANTAVHLGLHDKNKTAGSKESYPQFDVADAGRVLQDLSTGARSTRMTQTDVEYGKLPTKTKLSSATVDSLMEELFKTADSADLDYTVDSVIEDVLGVKGDLTSLKESLTHSAQQLDGLHKQASEEFYELTKRHLLEGGGFHDILAAAQVPGLPYEKVAAALQPHVVRLIREQVASPEELKIGVQGIEKVAHRVVNPQHPLVTSFRAILASDDEIQAVALGLQEVDAELEKVAGFIKERLCGNG